MGRTREVSVDDAIHRWCNRSGHLWLKIQPFRVGAPDRLLVMPGRVMFVELKRPGGGTVARIQRLWLFRLLDKYGIPTIVAESLSDVKEAIK